MLAIRAKEPAMKRVQFAPAGRVLVVEDNSQDLQSYCASLQEQGYEVRACTNYPEGLRCLRSESFDFIVGSQGSHGSEGRSVLGEATERYRYTPVLVLTRRADSDYCGGSKPSRALEFFEEPLATEGIVWLVNSRSRPQVQGAAA